MGHQLLYFGACFFCPSREGHPRFDCNLIFFFFQAEDGIRDLTVTGVQTCALPILRRPPSRRFTPSGHSRTRTRWRRSRHATRSSAVAGGKRRRLPSARLPSGAPRRRSPKIGRASCRGREENSGGAASFKKKNK